MNKYRIDTFLKMKQFSEGEYKRHGSIIVTEYIGENKHRVTTSYYQGSIGRTSIDGLTAEQYDKILKILIEG